MCDLAVARAVGVHHIELPHAAVLLYAGVGHSVEYLTSVGGKLRVGYPAEAEHDFGCELAVHDLYRSLLDNCGGALPAALGVGGHHCH